MRFLLAMAIVRTSAERLDDMNVSFLVRHLARCLSVLDVRREKAALSSGYKPHPATVPAGSNRSRHGGDEMSEALG